MASTGEVAARIRAACEKAERSRAALEQAEDLAREAHDILTRALEGAHRLEPDVAAMSAAFVSVRDGLKAHLWPLITEALEAAEGIAARLEGTGTSSPAPAPLPLVPPVPVARRSAPPPVRRTDTDAPPVIPPERIEQLRRELPEPVVPTTGQKTHGWWIGPDGEARPIVSGRDARSDLVNRQLAEKGAPRRTPRAGDVEMKLAAHMAENGIRHATVTINHTPCKGPMNCDTLVPILLPEGATLTEVISPTALRALAA